MPAAPLSTRTVIALSGEDRISFLQGLITNDAGKLADGNTLYSALLSPQGKFLHDFFLTPDGARILLDVDSARAPDLLARLNIYKLRAKVALEPLPQMQVTAVWDAPPPATEPASAIAAADPRFPPMGWRIYGVCATDAPLVDYEAHRIALAVPDGAKDMTADKSLLLEFRFEALHGVSFSKGCYVGQEVTARSKFRGQVRKLLFGVEGDTALPASGTPITGGGAEIGELRSVSGKKGLALLRTELLEKTAAPLMAGTAQINYHIPAWAAQQAG